MAGSTPDERIAWAWRELRRGHGGNELRRQMLRPTDPRLEQAQIDALEILAESGELTTMSDFADAMHVDPSTATRAIDRLQRIGLVERVPGGDDRRFVQVRVTADGDKVVRRIRRARADGMRRLLASFGDEEREAFASYMDRFVDAIDQLVHDLELERYGR